MEKQTYEELTNANEYALPPDWEDGKNTVTRKRSVPVSFRVTERELAQIKKRMDETNIEQYRAFFLTLANNATVVHYELENIREVSKLLGNVANNLNQISRRVNETENLYAEDVTDLQEHYNLLLEQWSTALNELNHVTKAVML
jgi:archaellum component FlaC